ncbi:MAG: hypothetical protein WBA99_18730 [Nodosilinea sp.]
MSDGQQETTLERRVILPEPDASNITVLTESLPNEPVLPWHHFDSPWLEHADATPTEPVATVDDNAEAATTEQLTLELEVLLETAESAVPDDDNLPPSNSSEGAAV